MGNGSELASRVTVNHLPVLQVVSSSLTRFTRVLSGLNWNY